MLLRPKEEEYEPAFHRYITMVPEGNFLELLGMQTHETKNFFEQISEETANYSYAPGKWSIKEVLGHVIDSERIFAYRALCIARGEAQALPGFDQDVYAREAGYDRMPISRVVQHYTALRVSTFCLLEYIPDGAWIRTGTSNLKTISVRALAYIIAGHERYHMAKLSELYGQQVSPLIN